MRQFYIFRINREILLLTKDNPYNLYRMMDEIYGLKTHEVDVAMNIFETIIKPIDKKNLNLCIFDNHKSNDHYTKYNNVHMINNYYNDENTELRVNSTYMLLKSSKANPIFLKDLKFDKSLFVCDFVNKDYFWLSELRS